VYHNVIRKSSTDEPPEPERKERVIHTRVSESLETELRQKAEDLGISVSNLVRNVLGHAFGLVGDVVADGQAIARAARGGRPASGAGTSAPRNQPPAMPPRSHGSARSPSARDEAAVDATIDAVIDDVLGWQPIVLGKNAVCARCNDIMPRSSDAAIGIPEAGGSRLVICLVCLEQMRAAPATEEPR